MMAVATVNVTFTVQITMETGLNEDSSLKAIGAAAVEKSKTLIENGINRAVDYAMDYHERQRGAITAAVKVATPDLVSVRLK